MLITNLAICLKFFSTVDEISLVLFSSIHLGIFIASSNLLALQYLQRIHSILTSTQWFIILFCKQLRPQIIQSSHKPCALTCFVCHSKYTWHSFKTLKTEIQLRPLLRWREQIQLRPFHSTNSYKKRDICSLCFLSSYWMVASFPFIWG